MALADFARLNERRVERRRGAVHEPAQLGGGIDPPARPEARRAAPAAALGLRRRASSTTSPHDEAAVRRPERRRRRRHVVVGRARCSASTATPRRSTGCATTGSRSTTQIDGRRDLDEILAACRGWEQRREQLPFEIDGVVIKVDDHELQRRLGSVGRDPRWAIAWKFPPRTAVTTLRDVVWSVGKFGDLHPYAVLDAGQRLGRDRQPGDAAQRGGPGAQGRAARRPGDRAARRRRDPAGDLARAPRDRP